LIIDQIEKIRLPVLLDKAISVKSVMVGMNRLAAVDIDNARIKISIPHLVHLWAATQQYYLYRSAIVKHAGLGKRVSWTFDGLCTLQPGLTDAMRQYERTREDVPYGKKIIANYEDRQLCCHEDHCDEVTALCAAALLWILLHETSHIICGHPPDQPSPALSRQEEEEADRRATELFFKLAPDDKNSQFHYGFGLLIALIELFPPKPRKAGPTYPEYHERLAVRLFELDPDENLELYYLAALLLERIIIEWQIPTPAISDVELPLEHAQEAVIKYYDTLRNHINNL